MHVELSDLDKLEKKIRRRIEDLLKNATDDSRKQQLPGLMETLRYINEIRSTT